MRKSSVVLIVVCMLAIAVLSCGRAGKEASASSSMFDRDDTVKSAYISILDDRVASIREELYGSLARYDAEVESESWDDAGKAELPVID